MTTTATATSQSAPVTVTLGGKSAAGMAVVAAAAAAAASNKAKTATGSAPRRRRSLANVKRSAGPLAGVCAMVDVRVGAEAQIDCSDVVARKLRELGASTVSRFCPKLTHMVLSHLTPTWKLKIAKWQSGVSTNSSAANNGSTGISATELMLISQRRNLKIVSQLWVNACYVSKQRMEEKPFFPISKASDSIAPPRPVISSRHSLGSMRLKRSSPSPEQMSSSGNTTDENVNTTNGADTTPIGQKTTAGASTGPAGLKLQTPQRRAATTRKRRALSMEPMTSDAILKLLESSGVTTDKSITSQETDANTAKNVELPRAKRRKSISDIKSAPAPAEPLSQPQPESLPPTSTDTQTWSECVAESESDDEAESTAKSTANKPREQKAKAVDAVKPVASAALTAPSLRRTRSATALAAANAGAAVSRATVSRSRGRARTDNANSNISMTPTAPASGTKSAPKQPRTAPVAAVTTVRRRTGHPGIALKSGIWSCTACGCSNPRAHRVCRICCKAKNAPAPADNSAASSAERPPAATGASTTAGTASKPVPATPSSSSSLPPPAPSKTPKRAPIAPSSAVKAPRTPMRAAPTVVSPPTPADNVLLQSIHRQRQTSGKVPITPSVITLKTPHKPRMSPSTQSTTAASPSPQKPFPSAILLKRLAAGSPVSTPASKRQRVSSPATTSGEVSDLGTPQSVASSTPRRSKSSVASTSMTIKATAPASSVKKTPRKPRVVIAITGLDPEARDVIECAVHAIDANMLSEEGGHRKARVVKSLDYAAAVTHLIVGQEAKRTIKVLFAIARGAWIVPESWVFSSLEKERWLPEEPFEMSVFANKHSRLHAESRQIFRGLKFFVGSNVEPSREVMQSLIQCAGGEICNQISVADVCICADSSLFRRAQRTGVRVVSSKWVFDSIAGMKLEDERKYSPVGGAPAAPATGLEAASTEPAEDEDEDDAYQQEVAKVSA